VYNARPAYGDEGYTVPGAKAGEPPIPNTGTDHQWILTALFSVSQASVERAAAVWMAGGDTQDQEISMDHENLMTVQGPGCYKCGMPLMPSTYQTPCPVRITYVTQN
jgi:hypothetical protein